MKVMICFMLLLPLISYAMDSEDSTSCSDSTVSSPLNSPRPFSSPRKSRSAITIAAAQRVRLGEGNDSPERCSPRGKSHYEDLKKRRDFLLEQRSLLLSDENACLEIDYKMRALQFEITDFEKAGEQTKTFCDQSTMMMRS